MKLEPRGSSTGPKACSKQISTSMNGIIVVHGVGTHGRQL
jgi:hypothetical protein